MSYFEQGFALIIGIARYLKVSKLSEAILKDALKLHDIVRAPEQCGYRDEHVKLLINEEATAEGIRAGFSWLAQSVRQNATAFIYYSGHGWRVEAGSEVKYFLIPHNGDLENLDNSAISMEELTALIRNIPASRLLFCIDSCYAAGLAETKAPEQVSQTAISQLDESYYAQLCQGTGRVILASSRHEETSRAMRRMNSSLFTYYLLESLNGKAHVRNDGLIRVLDVFHHISENVPAHKPQHPIFKNSDLDSNFPIALYRGGKSTGNGSGQQNFNINKRELRAAIFRSFNEDALNVLCADIEQDIADDGFDDIPVNLEVIGRAAGLENKILQLIEYLEHRNLLKYLIMAVRKKRPGII